MNINNIHMYCKQAGNRAFKSFIHEINNPPFIVVPKNFLEICKKTMLDEYHQEANKLIHKHYTPTEPQLKAIKPIIELYKKELLKHIKKYC